MQKLIVQPTKIDSPLLEHRNNVTSQMGEDGVIAHMVEVLKPQNTLCVEFGAWDGKHFSNCYNLITELGWDGIMIEANASKFSELVETYGSNPKVKTVNRLVDFEGPNTLDRILDECGAPADIGLISIDIDGNDYHIWESLETHRPEVLVIEFNPSVPNDVIFIQDKSFEVNQGCSLRALVALGKRKGYELAVCTGWNAFFVKAEKLALLGVTDNRINRLYHPLQNGRIFQGYDGTIHVVGMDRFLWLQGAAIGPEDFQILPRSLRTFGDAQRK